MMVILQKKFHRLLFFVYCGAGGEIINNGI